MKRPGRLRFIAALAIAWLGRSPQARAQSATALDPLSPSPAGDTFLTAPSAGVSARTRLSAALLGSLALRPLRLQAPDGSPAELQRQALVHAQLAVELAGRLKLEADLPLVVDQTGDEAVLGDVRGPGLGDLRLGARATLLRQQGAWPAVAAAGSVWLPTHGVPYGGTDQARWAPGVIVGSDLGTHAWSVSLGRRFQQPAADSLTASDLQAGAAYGLRLGPARLGPEVWLRRAVEDNAAGVSARKTSGEALLTARLRVGPLLLSVGGGPGFGQAPGTPSARLLAGIAYAPEPVAAAEPPPPAAPSEAQIGASPALSGPASSAAAAAAAAADRDGDGVADSDDRCPDVPGDNQGCPPDRDGDGVPDRNDRCPDAAGVASLDAAVNGCPPDQDGDGIVDSLDACPREKGEPSEDPAARGCPKAVRVQGEQIVILQQVTFRSASDAIEPQSFALLQQVVDVIQQHPEVARVAIDGHTDDKGVAALNTELSRRRAAAVMRWMIERGVDARRLEARGFGPRRPIDSNKTEAGRAKNRRVEFQILRRTPLGEAGWKEGNEP